MFLQEFFFAGEKLRYGGKEIITERSRGFSAAKGYIEFSHKKGEKLLFQLQREFAALTVTIVTTMRKMVKSIFFSRWMFLQVFF